MEDAEELGKVMIEAIQNTAIPKIYANGFVNALSNGDITIMLQRNGEPIAILNLSFTIAKTLSFKIASMVKDLEEKSANKIMTTDDIQKILNVHKKEK